MKDTKQNILSKALELFNEKGVEYVGMRELAAAMNTRIGNITYYFPTKDDLVHGIGAEYAQLNTQTRAAHTVVSIATLLSLFEALFRNQVAYRCMLLSFVHIMEHNVAAAQAYKSVRTQRTSANEAVLRGLAASGYLKADEAQVLTLAQSFNLINRFWLSEAIISGHPRGKLHAQIPKYLGLVAGLLKPYATAKGLREIKAFLGEE